MEWKVPFDLRWHVCNCVAFGLHRTKTMGNQIMMVYHHTIHSFPITTLWGRALEMPFFPFFWWEVLKNHKNHMVGPIQLLFDTSMEIGEMPCTHGYATENIEWCFIWICAMTSKEPSFPFGHGYHLVQTNGYPNKNQRKNNVLGIDIHVNKGST